MKPGFVCALLVSIIFAVGCGSNPATNTPPPSKPTTVEASATTLARAPTVSAAGLSLQAEAKDTVIILTWTPVSGASGYFVYRDAGPNPLNAKPIAETTYQDIGLTNGRTYSYTVAVVSADGAAGSPSAPVTAVPKSH